MKINIPNDSCVPEIDDWLVEHIPHGGWVELFNPLHAVPYRSFEILDGKMATLFALRWL